MEKCDKCLDEYKKNPQQRLPCLAHQGCGATYWNRGQPKDSTHIENIVKKVMKDNADYQSKGATPLTPKELLTIRAALVSTNKIWDLQIWTMTLIACKLFLRSDELVQLNFGNVVNLNQENAINWDLTRVDTDNLGIRGIAFNIKGKSDKKIQVRMLWADDDKPELCPVRHLMCYLYWSGIRSGYFFPPESRLNKLVGGHVSTHVRKTTYHTAFVRICKSHIARAGPFGSHSNRKTAYLLAIWGGGSETDIAESARHKSLTNAMMYKKGASFLFSYVEASGLDPRAMVSKWKPIACANADISSGLVPYSQFDRNLFNLSTNFVEKILVIPRSHPSRTLTYVVSKALEYQRPSNATEELDQALAPIKDIYPDVVTRVKKIVTKIVLEKSIAQTLPAASVSANSENVNSNAPVVTKKRKKKKQGGDDNLVLRKQVTKKKKLDEKLLLLLEIRSLVPQNRQLLTDGKINFLLQLIL